MTARKAIRYVGDYGARVNVFELSLGKALVTRVEWRECGTRKTVTFRGAKTERDRQATTFAKDTAKRLITGPVAPAVEAHTVGDIWSKYVNAHFDWREATLRLNSARWKNFEAEVRTNTLATLITAETIDAWRKKLSTKAVKHGAPMAPNQAAHHVQLVKAVFAFAATRGYLPTNRLAPVEVRIGRHTEAMRIAEYSPAEWAKILAELNGRRNQQWRPWAAVALGGILGTRASALLSLQWSDVDLSARIIRWPAATDKVGKARDQPLPRDAVMILRTCRVWARRDGYPGDHIFYGSQQRTRHTHWTYSALVAQLHLASDRAKVSRKKYRAMHGLRRMAGNNALDATGDLTKVGKWLGDTDLRVLEKSYLRRRDGDLDAVVADANLPPRTRRPT